MGHDSVLIAHLEANWMGHDSVLIAHLPGGELIKAADDARHVLTLPALISAGCVKEKRSVIFDCGFQHTRDVA